MVFARTPSTSITDARKRMGHRLGLAASAIGLVGLGFRSWLTVLEAPPTNSDEATFGLVALHVSQGAGFPVYLYGQHYMGTLESYLAAPLIALTGPTTYALRIGTLIFYGMFLVAMYVLTKRIYSPGLALLTVALLALGSDRVVKDQLIADGSAELAFFAAVLVLLALVVGSARSRRRRALLTVWGLVAGLALWDHLLVLPYLGAAVLVMSFSLIRRKPDGQTGLDLGKKDVLAALVGFTLGAAPMLVYQFVAPAGADPLSVLLHHSSAGEATWRDRLYGAVFLGVPLATGMCEPSFCQPWQSVWGPACIGLLLASAYLAWRTIRSTTRGHKEMPETLRACRTRAVAQLALAVGALVTIVMYARSPAAGNTPIESARYLSLLPVSAPAIVWPFWQAARARRHVLHVSARIGIAILLMAMSWATFSLARHAPAYSQQAEKQRELLAAFERLDVSYYYTEYWTCNRLAYASGERVVCIVLNSDLTLGHNRHQRYMQLVKDAHDVAYVAPVGSTFDQNVGHYLLQEEGTLRVTEVAGYRLYLSTAHPPLT